MRLSHVISISDFKREDLDEVLSKSADMLAVLNKGGSSLLNGKVLATLFFEPSTRTRLSFESAMHRLGGSVIGFTDPDGTSLRKGETTADTIQTVAGYCDIIAMRHPNPGAARLASEVSPVPIVNGGDGSHQHPTQTLLDLFTIKQELGTLDSLRVAMVGDLKYGRTVHSLVRALSHYNASFKLVSPKQLPLPDEYKRGTQFEETNTMDISGCDVVYMTRIQRERFPDSTEYERLKGRFVIDQKAMKTLADKSIVMHPLPRVDEIAWQCDPDPRCVYFKQAHYGVATRMAVMAMLLGAV